jgi:hypothetical protein
MGLIRRITVLKSSGETVEAVTVHQEPRKRPRVSAWTSPLEHAARRLVRAQVVFGQEVLRRHNRSNRRRRDGWLLEGPANLIESGRKAFNEEVRKGMPFRLLPKL